MFILSIRRSDGFIISFQYLMLDPKLKMLIGSIQQPINLINKQNVHPAHMIMATNCMVSHELHAAHVEELSLLALVVHSAQTACSMNTRGASCSRVAAVRNAGGCLHPGFVKMFFKRICSVGKKHVFGVLWWWHDLYAHQLTNDTWTKK